jgi:Mg2+ and Co2+ transporter CorA
MDQIIYSIMAGIVGGAFGHILYKRGKHDITDKLLNRIVKLEDDIIQKNVDDGVLQMHVEDIDYRLGELERKITETERD